MKKRERKVWGRKRKKGIRKEGDVRVNEIEWEKLKRREEEERERKKRGKKEDEDVC